VAGQMRLQIANLHLIGLFHRERPRSNVFVTLRHYVQQLVHACITLIRRS